MPIQIRGEDNSIKYEFPHTLTPVTSDLLPNEKTNYITHWVRDIYPWITGGFEAKEVNQGFDASTTNKAYAQGAVITGDGMAQEKKIVIDGVIKGYGHVDAGVYYTAQETLLGELDRMRRFCYLPQTNDFEYRLFLSQYIPELENDYTNKGYYFRFDRGFLRDFNVEYITEAAARVIITIVLGDPLRYLVREFTETHNTGWLSPTHPSGIFISSWQLDATAMNGNALGSPPTITIKPINTNPNVPIYWIRVIKYGLQTWRADFVGSSPLLIDEKFRVNMETAVIQRNNTGVESQWVDDYREFDREFFEITPGENSMAVAMLRGAGSLNVTFDWKQVMV